MEGGSTLRRIDVKSPSGFLHQPIYIPPDYNNITFDNLKLLVSESCGVGRRKLILVGVSQFEQYEELGPDNFVAILKANSFIIWYTTITIRDMGDSVVRYSENETDKMISRLGVIQESVYDFENKWFQQEEEEEEKVSNDNSNIQKKEEKEEDVFKNIVIIVLKTPGFEYTKEIYVQKDLPNLLQILEKIAIQSFGISREELRLVKDTKSQKKLLTTENVYSYFSRNRTVFVHSRKTFNQ